MSDGPSGTEHHMKTLALTRCLFIKEVDKPLPHRKLFMSSLPRDSTLATIGVTAYIAGFALPFSLDIPLILLAVFSILAMLSTHRSSLAARPPLVFAVLVFLIASGVSILVAPDMIRSAQLSAPFLPAILLFFVIAEHFRRTQQVRLLHLTLSIVSLGLASAVLWMAWRHRLGTPTTWVKDVGSPILVVPNDVLFLAVITPLSLALLHKKLCSSNAMRVFLVLSIIVSACAIGVLQSRGAVLTMVVAVVCFATLLRPRLGIACSLLVLIPVLIVDALLGFPLLTKFDGFADSRIRLWLATWAMFLDAPVMGHGAHTFVLLYKPYLNDLSLPSWIPVDPHASVPWAHNLYLEVLAEQGIVGLSALMFLLACGVSIAWRLRRAPASDVRILGAGAFAALVTFCFAAIFELSFNRQWVVIVLFALLGLLAHLSILARGHKDQNDYSK